MDVVPGTESPELELYFLMGADSLRDFPTWREPERILELSTLAVVNRGDQPTPDVDGFIMVLATPTTPPLDLAAPISCDWRPGDVW